MWPQFPYFAETYPEPVVSPFDNYLNMGFTHWVPRPLSPRPGPWQNQNIEEMGNSEWSRLFREPEPREDA